MTAQLGGSVGRKCVNAVDDVKVVQTLLRNHIRWLVPFRLPEPSGHCDAETERAIAVFQERAAAMLKPNSVVSPSSYTFKALARVAIEKPKHPIFDARNWKHDTTKLTAADYAAAAKELDCEPAMVEAVERTESEITSPWDKEGRPTILFERHKFSKHTKGAFDSSHPDISNPKWGGHGYIREQYPKLTRAAVLNEQAALKSASWGAFQILGENHVAAGFPTVDAFVSAMMTSEAEQLKAFVKFVKANKVMWKALRNKDWTRFAKLYNGPAYKDNDYDTKMAAKYRELTSAKPKTPAVKPAPPVLKMPGPM